MSNLETITQAGKKISQPTSQGIETLALRKLLQRPANIPKIAPNVLGIETTIPEVTIASLGFQMLQLALSKLGFERKESLSIIQELETSEPKISKAPSLSRIFGQKNESKSVEVKNGTVGNLAYFTTLPKK
jgi:hypothetical protein